MTNEESVNEKEKWSESNKTKIKIYQRIRKNV